MEEENIEVNEPTQDVQEQPAVEIAPERLRQFQLELESGQNLPMGVVAGLAAALVSAGIWAGITVGTGYQIGWIAVGVGFLVGIAVRSFGKGISPIFGYIGAGLALLGCLLGNLLSCCIILAQQDDVGFMDVVRSLDVAVIVELFKVTFSPIDLLFYGIAIYEGYRFSFRQISEEEWAGLVNSEQE